MKSSSGLRRSASFSQVSLAHGTLYKHPERVHLLPPPEVTRIRSLITARATNTILSKIRTKKEKREASPVSRKLPLPEIFYHAAELEERGDDSLSSVSGDDVVDWSREERPEHVGQEAHLTLGVPYPHRSQADAHDPDSSSESPSPSPPPSNLDSDPLEMVSRRAILYRSRDDMQQPPLSAGFTDQWFSRERLYKDHIQEVLEKWDNIEDSIWAKVIVLERNRRVAKAYARTPVLTVNGSTEGFDGFRIGLNGFANPLRDAKVVELKREIGVGCKLKMDDGGNILVKRLDSNGIYVKNTAEETAVSNDVLKLPGGLLEKDRAVKLFDMKKFQQNINREMKRQRPERNKLETQCISTLAFVRNETEVLDSPIWVMIINIVALEMLGDKMPIKVGGNEGPAHHNTYNMDSHQTNFMQTLKRNGNALNSSSDEDPYSLTHSGSSGYSGQQRAGSSGYGGGGGQARAGFGSRQLRATGPAGYGTQLRPGPIDYVNKVRSARINNLEDDGDPLSWSYDSSLQQFYNSLTRPTKRFERQGRPQKREDFRKPGKSAAAPEDPYYSGYSARMTDFSVSRAPNRDRALSRDAILREKNDGNPWWQSRLYSDSGVDVSSGGSVGSPALALKAGQGSAGRPGPTARDHIQPGPAASGPATPSHAIPHNGFITDDSASYFPGLLRNGGLALKTKELSSFHQGNNNTRRRKDLAAFFNVNQRPTLFKQGWE